MTVVLCSFVRSGSPRVRLMREPTGSNPGKRGTKEGSSAVALVLSLALAMAAIL